MQGALSSSYQTELNENCAVIPDELLYIFHANEITGRYQFSKHKKGIFNPRLGERFIFIRESHRLRDRTAEKRYVTLTNVNLCPHGRRIELL